MRSLIAGLGLVLSIISVSAGAKALFQQHCGSCHSLQSDGRIPGSLQLARMNPLAVLAAIESGTMRIHAEKLTVHQRQQLVEELTGKQLAQLHIPESAYCAKSSAPIDAASTVYWSGWGGDPQGSGYAGEVRAKIALQDVQRLQPDWVFAFPGVSQARSQPAVVDNVVIVGGAEGSVTALDGGQGCIYWRTQTASSVRGAIAVYALAGRLVVFAVASNTDVYALEASTGAVIWRQRAGFHPYHSVTGTPAIHAGRVYVPISSIEVGVARLPVHECCVSSGGVVALRAVDGEMVWQMRTAGSAAAAVGESAGKRVFAPSGAPVWASPTVDAKRQLLYVGTGENYSRPTTATSDAILALALATGEVVWSYQATPDDAWHSGCDRMPEYAPCDDPGPDFDFGMAPIIVTAADGRDRLLAGQKSGVVYALDPDRSGRLLWQTRVGKGTALGGVHWGMAADDKQVYVANADRPAIIKDVNPGTPLSPGMYGLDIMSGRINWATPTPGPSCQPDPKAGAAAQRAGLRDCLTSNSAAPTVIDGLVFAGDLYGNLRAYDTVTGAIVWTFDTNKAFHTVNQIPGRGGSIDGPGPVIANGRIYVNSGYGSFGQRPGNILLSLSPRN